MVPCLTWKTGVKYREFTTVDDESLDKEFTCHTVDMWEPLERCKAGMNWYFRRNTQAVVYKWNGDREDYSSGNSEDVVRVRNHCVT